MESTASTAWAARSSRTATSRQQVGVSPSAVLAHPLILISRRLVMGGKYDFNSNGTYSSNWGFALDDLFATNWSVAQ
jgi:hypothetical protein